MNELSRFLPVGICCLLLLVSGCETQPVPVDVAGVPTPTAVPVTATSTPTIVLPTVTAVPTLAPTLTPATPAIVPLHFDHLQDSLSEDEIVARLAPWLFEPDVANALPLGALADLSAEGRSVLTPEQAEEDVAYLFALLKNGYAGYGYFNENGRFDRVRGQLNGDIEAQEQARVSSSWLLEQITTRLDFVQDCHFSISSYRLCQQQYFWYVADWFFYEENGRYFTWQAGEQWWLTAVDDQQPEDMLKLTIDEAGAPAYLLGQLVHSLPKGSLLTFDLPDGSSVEQKAGWQAAVFEAPVITYETYRTDGDIPVVVSRSFPAEDEKLPHFVADAAALADEPLVIVDIRGNNGGSSLWGEQWLENLTGLSPAWPMISTGLWTETAVQGNLNFAKSLGFEDSFDFLNEELAQLRQDGSEGGWTEPLISTFSLLPNENQLVIVLIDKGVGSSGELFIGYLRQLENVIFIGENSGGVGQIGELAQFVLPNSGLQVQFGTKLFFPPDLSSTEGIGYLPDVWLPADQALARTLTAIEAGWLQPAP